MVKTNMACRLLNNKYLRERKELQNSLSEVQDIFDEPELTESRFDYARKLCATLRQQIRNNQQMYNRSIKGINSLPELRT